MSRDRSYNEGYILFRSLALWGIILLLTLFFAIWATLFGYVRLPSLAHLTARVWGKILQNISGTRMIVSGAEKLYREGPTLLLLNHQSLFDGVIIYSFLDIPFRWMAKASLFKIPLFGSGMKGAGYIPVERGDKKRALHSLYEAAHKIRQGSSVIIFPEGTRGLPDGTMLPFKKGGFILAKKAGVVLQPLILWGSNQIVPIQRKRWIQRIYPGTVRVEVLDPIQPEEYGELSVDGIAYMVHSRMESVVERLKEEDSTTKT